MKIEQIDNTTSIYGTRDELQKLMYLIELALDTCDMVENNAKRAAENGLPEYFASIHPFSDYFGDVKIEIGCDTSMRS